MDKNRQHRMNRNELYLYLKESVFRKIKNTKGVSSDIEKTADELASPSVLSICDFVEKYGHNYKTENTYDGIAKILNVSKTVYYSSTVYEIKDNFVFSNAKFNLPITIYKNGQFDLPYKGNVILNQIGFLKDFEDDKGHIIPFKIVFVFQFVQSDLTLKLTQNKDFLHIDKCYQMNITSFEELDKIPNPLAKQILDYLITNKEEILNRNKY